MPVNRLAKGVARKCALNGLQRFSLGGGPPGGDLHS